jgi:hypothetical protein
MAWDENHGVDFLFGVARNRPLVAQFEAELAEAAELSGRTGKPPRRFKDFAWRTWTAGAPSAASLPRASRPRARPTQRFVVTALSRQAHQARHLYEKLYRARGEMENRIKECQPDLYADCTSAKTMRANQLRLFFASIAYVLLCALRRIGPAHIQFVRASCGTTCLKIPKIGALVRTSVRRNQARHALGPPLSGRVPHRPRRAHHHRQLTPGKGTKIMTQPRQPNAAPRYPLSVLHNRPGSLNANRLRSHPTIRPAVRDAG